MPDRRRSRSAEPIDHLSRVVFDPADEGRPAPPQHRQAQGVETRAVDDTAVVAEVTLRVDDRDVQPPVVGPETGCPDDRADLAASEVERQPRRPRHLGRLEALWAGERRHLRRSSGPTRRTCPAAVPASGRPERTRFGGRRRRARDRHERPPSDPPARRPSSSGRSGRASPAQASRRAAATVAAAPAEDRRPRRTARPRRRTRPSTSRTSRPAVRSRQPHVLADREDHRSTRSPQLGRELHTRCRRPHDEHAAVRELRRVAVRERRHLLDARRHRRLRAPAPSAGCRPRSRGPPCATGSRPGSS